MFPVEPGRRCERNEELGTVGIGPRVGHAEDARTRVLEANRDFVLKLVAIDGAAASPCACRVATLDHEVGNNTVEEGGIEVAAADESGEVGAGLWSVLSVEFQDY